jgi:hypothetical protein
MRALLLILILILSSAANAHVGDRIYLIPEITDDALAELDVSDQSLDDWTGILANPTLTASDFSSDPTVGEGTPYDPTDMDYQIWLGWNGSTSRLFFALERTDDNFINEYEGGNPGHFWRHDGAFFFSVDGDHSGGDYSGSADSTWTDEEKTLNNNRTAQTFHGITDAPDGLHLGYDGAGVEWVCAVPYAGGSGGSTGEAPTTSIFEGFLTPFDDLLWHSPERSTVSQLHAGKIIGFEIGIYDFDTEEEYSISSYHALPLVPPWRYSEHFVDARLISGADDTAVESRSWARIKASFQGK